MNPKVASQKKGSFLTDIEEIRRRLGSSVAKRRHLPHVKRRFVFGAPRLRVLPDPQIPVN